MDFRLSQLQGFLALANHLHYAKASRALSVSQQTLMFRIGALEESLSVELFARTEKTLGLTDSGRQFRVYAQRIIDTTESARKCMNKFRALHPATVSSAPGLALVKKTRVLECEALFVPVEKR